MFAASALALAAVGCGLAGALRHDGEAEVSGNVTLLLRATPLGDDGELHASVGEVVTNVKLGPAASDVLMQPTLLISLGACVCILAAVVVNQVSRTLTCTQGLVRGSLVDWVWPVSVTGGLGLHCMWLYNVVLIQNIGRARDHAVAILMSMAVVWWLLTYLWEIRVKATPLCTDKEHFVAGDVYSDLTDSMFNVAVRFMMQASMLIILIHVAQEAVDSGSPENLSDVRIFINFCIAVTLELYLFVASRDHTTWEDLRRLRGVRAVKHSDAKETGDAASDIVYVAPGDFYVRFAMSVIVTGVFHKFLVLAYPLLVFTTFARDQWVVLLKDILAITFVMSLDNLLRPVSFIVHHSCDALGGSLGLTWASEAEES